MSPADYINPAFAPNFRAGWDALPEDSEMVDDYGIGQRDSLQVGAGGMVVFNLCSGACEGDGGLALAGSQQRLPPL